MNYTTRFFLFYFIGLLMISFSLSSTSHAAKVQGVRGKNVLINLENTKAQPGDVFFVVDTAGKRQGVVRIAQVRGQQAVAQLGRGQAQPGWSLVAGPTGAGTAQARTTPPAQTTAIQPARSTPSGRMLIGGLFGFSMTSMNIDPPDDSGYDLSGSAMSFKALLDYAVFSSVWLRTSLGFQQFSAESSSPDRSFDVDYMAADFWGRYVFTSSRLRPWVGAGISILFPLSKTLSSVAISESSIQTTSNFSAGGGIDFFVGSRFMLPLQLEYNLFPGETGVSANMISVRTGLALSF